MAGEEVSAYEQERLRRIEQNRQRMAELGLQQVRGGREARGCPQTGPPAPSHLPAPPARCGGAQSRACQAAQCYCKKGSNDRLPYRPEEAATV